jgi:hypothetical protein
MNNNRDKENYAIGEVPKWTKGADCKSVAEGFRGSNPLLPTRGAVKCGNSSMARASAFQAEGCGFESRFPLQRICPRGSVVEHFLGKEGVTSSILVVGSINGRKEFFIIRR